MRKVLLLLLIVGVLMMGTFSILEEFVEKTYCEDLSFLDSRDFGSSGHGGSTPLGEGHGGDGGGGAPG